MLLVYVYLPYALMRLGAAGQRAPQQSVVPRCHQRRSRRRVAAVGGGRQASIGHYRPPLVVVADVEAVAQRLRVYVGGAAEDPAARAVSLERNALRPREHGRVVQAAEASAGSKRPSASPRIFSVHAAALALLGDALALPLNRPALDGLHADVPRFLLRLRHWCWWWRRNQRARRLALLCLLLVTSLCVAARTKRIRTLCIAPVLQVLAVRPRVEGLATQAREIRPWVVELVGTAPPGARALL